MTREEEIIEKAGKESELFYNVNSNYGDCFHGGFIAGARWADEHPNTEDIETVLAYTYKGLGWLAENVEFDIGTTGDHALACTETLQLICNRAIMELRKPKKIKL